MCYPMRLSQYSVEQSLDSDSFFVFPQALTKYYKYYSHSGTVPIDSYGYLKYSKSNEIIVLWKIF